MHEDIDRAKQLEKRKNWTGGIVDPVVATVIWKKLMRTPKKYRVGSAMFPESDLTWEETESKDEAWSYSFLVTERLKGAARGHHQIHHGGHTMAIDKNSPHTAAREIVEETGFVVKPSDLRFVGKFGPELYRSTVALNGTLKGEKPWPPELTILNVQAEPGVAFVLDLFVTEVSDKTERLHETDKEVREVGWFTLYELVEKYGDSRTFNYWSFFFYTFKLLEGKRREDEIFADSSPGVYKF